MKIVIFTFIAGVAAAMLYFFLIGECPGGTVVRDAEECRGAGFDRDACNAALASARRKASEDYAPFPTLDQCLRGFALCEPHGAVSSGFVPVPRGYCIARTGSGGVDGTPVYERIGQRLSN